MPGGILPPHISSFQELFSGATTFHVPPYQRNFAWGKDEIEELSEDIANAMDRDGDYFLGTIVLQETSRSNYEIIDGQQRLACISMIFSAIRYSLSTLNTDLSKSNAARIFSEYLGARGYRPDSHVQPKLQLNRLNNPYFREYLVESASPDKVTSALGDKTIAKSNQELLEAYSFFLKSIQTQIGRRGVPPEEFLGSLMECVSSMVKLITITVTSKEDANLFFESLNARGKELAVSDLIKNRLYSEAENVIQAEDLWVQMEKALERRPIPDFLRHYWIAKKADEKNLLVREKKLYRSVAQAVTGGKDLTIQLLTDLKNSAKDYAKITDSSIWPDNAAYDDDFERSLEDLRYFRVSQCNPLLLNAIQLFSRPRQIARTFRIVANFAFRYFMIGNQSPGNMEREAGRIAYGIRTGTIKTAADVAEALRALSPDTTFKSAFEVATIPESNAKFARYVLARINDYIVGQHSKGREYVTNPNKKEVGLEHVFSLNPSSGTKSDFGPGVTPEDYVERIGNLTLLLKPDNKQIGSKPFLEKQELAYRSSTFPINEYLARAPKWGDVEISERQRELAVTALKVWQI